MVKKGRKWFIIGGIIMVIGIGLMIAGAVIQKAIGMEIYGTKDGFLYIEHWSCWLYLGIIPALIGSIMMTFGE